MVFASQGFDIASLLPRSNKYDGVLEYWVTTRETAQHTEAHETSEELKDRRKAVRCMCS